MEEQTTPVRVQHKFNVGNLHRYLLVKSLVSNGDTLTVRQYSAGQSNPTFLIQTSSSSYVLRKKPPGELLPGAHKVDREYRVQRALFSAGFPVPQPLLYCTDVEVIGTEFYLMEHVKSCSDHRAAFFSNCFTDCTLFNKARVIALLDWELSTTGNPLADLAYFLMPLYWPADLNITSSIGSLKGIEGNANVKLKGLSY
ncbi:hypothetical protein XENOCAPTIV_030506 [Xenoophorus captivus]|uniref:Aminoglycoside phosphotransferase domain-containing protein n=1 Tax=Xenoophorus captivus TaxID=1517983 RepID=A0ABV0RXS6_9TELE